MGRESARQEAAFMRGETGIDGQATEEQKDAAAAEADQAREQLLRGRTYLGRELLTWMLWRSEATDALFEHEGTGVHVLFTGRITLKGALGEVTELSAKGSLAPYSVQVKRAMTAGLLVHTARLRLTWGERVFELSLDAEHLDVKGAKLPELMTEEEDDRDQERLQLCDQLGLLVDGCIQSFLAERVTQAWKKKIVPEMRAWMEQGA